jgi:putative oxidoreductase
MLDFRKTSTHDVGKLFLRVAIGGLMLFHGVGKIAHGIGSIEHSLEAAGLPGFIGYGVYVAEVIAPILILLGYQTRPAALVVAIEMLAAILLSHAREVLAVQLSGAWAVEIEALYLLSALALFFIGAGRYRVTIAQHQL